MQVTGKDPWASVWPVAQMVADRALGSIPQGQVGESEEPQTPAHVWGHVCTWKGWWAKENHSVSPEC